MRKIWIAILMMATFPLFAEDVVTLEEALKSARENSISLESARITLESALRKQDAVMTTFMPDISLTAGVSTGAAFPGANGTQFGAETLDETAFAGLTVNASANASFSFTGNMITDAESRALQKESANLTYTSALNSIEDAVFTSYWNIAAQDSAIEIAEISYLEAKAQYESALESYENGLTDELSLLQLEYAMRNAENNLNSLRDAKEIMMSAFRNITGLEGDFSVEPFPGMTKLALPSPEELFDEYAESTVTVRTARNNLAISRNAAESAKLGTYVPVLTASVGYSYAGSGYQHYKGNWYGYSSSANGLTGSIAVSIPISSMLPGSSSSISIQEAEDGISLSALSLQKTMDDLMETIREGVITINQNQNNIETQLISQAAAERAYELAQESYDSGLMTANDLSSARNDMLSAQLTVLSTELEHLLSCYDVASALDISVDEMRDKYAMKETSNE